MDYQRICLLHYHEIGLKGKNRVNFEMRLVRNVEAMLKPYPVAKITRISGRVCVVFDSEANYEVTVQAADLLARVPGVARVSTGYRCERNIDDMVAMGVKALAEVGDFTTWKVAARRNHTDFPICSMDMNRLIGDGIFEAYPEKVIKMKDPDAIVGVEVVEGFSYVYARSIRGIGGLPVGSSGTVMCLLSSGIDSPVALWRIARRGAVCVGVHFSGRPETTDESEYLVDDIAEVLQKTGCIGRVYVVPFGSYQRQISLMVPPSLRIIIYRRLMFKVAQRLSWHEHAGALVTGESLGQVASQTLENIRCTDAAVEMPVFRPLIGTDKLEIIGMAKELGTFEISSQQAPDCCTLFMPRSPETHAKLEDVMKAEEALPIDQWVTEIAELAEIHDYACPSYRAPKPKKKKYE